KDADEAVRLAPKNAVVIVVRGNIQVMAGKFDKAIEDYDEAIRLDPNLADAFAGRAMLRAACSDAKIRDGKKAVEDAKQACELLKWSSPGALESYAAALAEAGDFAEAVKWQKKAMEDAAYMKTSNGPDARKRLALYEAKKPFHFAPTKSE